MKGILTLVVCLFVVFFFIVGPVVIAYRSPETPALKAILYSNIMPGYKVPDRAACGYEGIYANSPSLSCELARDGQYIYFDYNRNTGVIDYVSYFDLKDSVRELIYAWGLPDGYTHEGSSWWFYWADRRAYIVPRYGLSWDSKVGVLVFASPNTDYRTWPRYGGLPYD